MSNRLLVFIAVLFGSFQLRANVEIELNEYIFQTSTESERLDEIYALCDDTRVNLDSTITFLPTGCTAPVLISMDAMRSSADPFDPSMVGADEIALLTPPYDIKFDSAGMYVIFCDPSFKTFATCITVFEPSEPIPTVGEWGVIILGLLIVIAAVRAYQQQSQWQLS